MFTQYECIKYGVAIGILVLGRLFFRGPKCNIKKDLTGKIVIVTGANTGIGLDTAIGLAKMNATVIIGCRNQERG